MDLQCGAALDLPRCRVRALSGGSLHRAGDVVRGHLGVPRHGDRFGRFSIRAHASLCLRKLAGDFLHRSHGHALPCRVLESCARDDHGIRAKGKERSMSRLLTRRTLVTAGLTAAAGASGLAAAGRYGLIPPDYGGIFGIGETLTYSAQRLLTSGHSMAREFQRSEISKAGVVNGPAPKDEAFRTLAAGGFKDW